jgi:hypothetical protein
LNLPDDNLDTGETTSAAEYRLTDETYAELLRRVSSTPVSNALRQDILSYYSDLAKPYATKRNLEKWEELVKRLDELKSTPVSGASTL